MNLTSTNGFRLRFNQFCLAVLLLSLLVHCFFEQHLESNHRIWFLLTSLLLSSYSIGLYLIVERRPRQLRSIYSIPVSRWPIYLLCTIFALMIRLNYRELLRRDLISYDFVRLDLSPDSVYYRLWNHTDNDPQTTLTSIELTLFNITNAKDLEHHWSSKIVQANEIGPFVFTEHTERFGQNYSDNRKTLHYFERKWYRFDWNRSNCVDLDQMIMVPNYPWIVAKKRLEQNRNRLNGSMDRMWMINGTVLDRWISDNIWMDNLEQKWFIWTTPRDIIFGIEQQLNNESKAKIYEESTPEFDWNKDPTKWKNGSVPMEDIEDDEEDSTETDKDTVDLGEDVIIANDFKESNKNTVDLGEDVNIANDFKESNMNTVDLGEDVNIANDFKESNKYTVDLGEDVNIANDFKESNKNTVDLGEDVNIAKDFKETDKDTVGLEEDSNVAKDFKDFDNDFVTLGEEVPNSRDTDKYTLVLGENVNNSKDVREETDKNTAALGENFNIVKDSEESDKITAALEENVNIVKDSRESDKITAALEEEFRVANNFRETERDTEILEEEFRVANNFRKTEKDTADLEEEGSNVAKDFAETEKDTADLEKDSKDAKDYREFFKDTEVLGEEVDVDKNPKNSKDSNKNTVALEEEVNDTIVATEKQKVFIDSNNKDRVKRSTQSTDGTLNHVFSLFGLFNGTQSGPHSIYTGLNGTSHLLGQFEMFNGKKRSSESEFNGNDPNIWPFDLKGVNLIWAFLPSVCSAVPFEFDRWATYKDIDVRKYQISLFNFEDYYGTQDGTQPETTNRAGFIDLSQCYGNILPLLLSKPFYADVDPSINKQVKIYPIGWDSSIDPSNGTLLTTTSQSSYQSFVMVHPLLGITLRSAANFQLSFSLFETAKPGTQAHYVPFVRLRRTMSVDSSHLMDKLWQLDLVIRIFNRITLAMIFAPYFLFLLDPLNRRLIRTIYPRP